MIVMSSGMTIGLDRGKMTQEDAMKRLLITLFLTLSTVVLVSCSPSGTGQSSVTETGNPCPGGDCPATAPAGGDEGDGETEAGGACNDAKAPLMTYSDKAVGFEFGFPACWAYTATDSGEGYSTVDLTDGREKTSMAAVEARKLSPVPSLVTVVTEANGDCAPVEYDTGKMKGLLCDKAAPGAGGSDWRIYYFLKGDLLVEMGFELFPSGEAGAARMLESLDVY